MQTFSSRPVMYTRYIRSRQLTVSNAQWSKYLRVVRRLLSFRDNDTTQHEFLPCSAPRKRKHHLARAVDGAAYAKVRGIAELRARYLPVVACQSVRASTSPNVPNCGKRRQTKRKDGDKNKVVRMNLQMSSGTHTSTVYITQIDYCSEHTPRISHKDLWV